MRDSLVETLPRLEARTAPPEGATAAGRRLPRWLLLVGFWTLIVLLYSTRQEQRLGMFDWERISWLDSLKASVAQWYPWGLMSVVIYWINRRLPLAPDALVQRVLVHVPLSIVVTVVYHYLEYGTGVLLGAPNDWNWLGATVFETAARVTYRLSMFVYWAIALFCVALDYQGHLKDRAIRSATLERMLAEARLTALRTQLDPHFLFNTLNSISAYVDGAPRKARLMIEQLGDLLRLSLDHADEQEIPLERELMFVDRYIQLLLVRFSDRLDVKVHVDPDVMNAAVPTFLLQPLIENAMRHGIAKLSNAGVIELSAWRSGEELHVRVRDNGPGLPRGWNFEQHKGVGLGHTRARLEQLYGKGEYSLNIASDRELGTCIDLVFPYRAA